jgi:hypothetical protein
LLVLVALLPASAGHPQALMREVRLPALTASEIGRTRTGR